MQYEENDLLLQKIYTIKTEHHEETNIDNADDRMRPDSNAGTEACTNQVRQDHP